MYVMPDATRPEAEEGTRYREGFVLNSLREYAELTLSDKLKVCLLQMLTCSYEKDIFRLSFEGTRLSKVQYSNGDHCAIETSAIYHNLLPDVHPSACSYLFISALL